MARDFTVNMRIRNIIDSESKKSGGVADKANIRRDTFSKIINCKRPVYADEVQPIAEALGVSVGALLCDEQTA